MKTNVELNPTEVFGVSDTTEFKIKTSAELFSLLSDGLYTDKILAVVRELSCNAWDAQKEAGNEKKPFRVHLPNQLEPFFYIRDFGTGLSHADVLNLYTTYGESTKNGSNDFIGALGVGSKSPYAYVHGFTVTSFFNGEHRSYTAFLSETGIPSITMMGDPQKTDEPNGLEVSLPVQVKDFHEFQKKAAKVYQRFDPLPEVVGGMNQFELPQVEYTVERKAWRLRKSSYYSANEAFAIQGKIAYPIDVRSMGEISDKAEKILRLNIDIDFAIGDLDIAASREGLGYKPRTVKNLVKKAEEIYDEVEKEISNEIKSAKTFWDACVAFGEFKKRDQDLGKIRINPVFKGKTVESQFLLETRNFPGMRFFAPNLISGSGNLRKGEAGWSLEIFARKNTRFILNDLDSGFWPRIKLLVEKNRLDKIFFIQADDSKETKKSLREFKKELQGMKFEKASSLPEPEKKKSSRQTATIFERDLDARSSFDRESWSQTDVDFENGGFYVEINNFRTRTPNGLGFYEEYNSWGGTPNGSSGRCLNKLVKALQGLKILDDDVKIYGVKTKMIPKFAEDTGWVNLFEFAKDQLSKYAIKHRLNDDVQLRYEFDRVSIPRWIENNTEKLKTLDFKPLTDLIDSYQKAKKIKERNSEKLETIQSLFRAMGESIPEDKSKKNLSLANNLQNLHEKAPLTKVTDFGWGTMSDSNFKALGEYFEMLQEKS